MVSLLRVQAAEKRERLSQLGVDEESLRQALERGLAEWAACTPNHPPSFPGLSAWGESVKTLRDLLAPGGWERSNEGNLPFTLNRAKTIALAVATGDESTGKLDATPCTKSSKGPRTACAVAENLRQLTLFPMEVLPEDLAKINGNGSRTTWLLLFYRDEQKREVRCELSRPTSMNDDGYVDGWIERIILEPILFDGDVIEYSSEIAPGSPAIDVEIRRRG